MDDNNNNMMEINTEESQKKKERQEKIDELKKKAKGILGKLKEAKDDFQKAKGEQRRVKEQAKQEQALFTKQANSTTPPQQHHSNGGFSSQTVTNKTISKNTTTKSKPQLSPQEIRRKKQKRRKIIRNIMTIPEIIFIVFLALFLKDRYVDYSKDVHQVLNYSADNYVYEIRRDNKSVLVTKSHRKECATAPCELEKITDYEVKYGKNQMKTIRLFFDLKFKFKNGTKSITIKDIKSELGKKCIYGIIHNNDYFLSFSSYSKYHITDSEQISTYTKRGYKYETDAGKYYLIIALGEKNSSGYGLVVNTAFKRGDDLYVYVSEQKPENDTTVSSLVTHPMVKLELEDAVKNIYVYDIDSGEEYSNLDVSSSEVQKRRIIEDLFKGFLKGKEEEKKTID